ncbi:hypothetical protein FHS23_002153 [Prauserella isguenensis]|uniref:Uncharacterized protein n=1 Tax=Prauserella isguenensis TaxID=1470180 RepID=A0A839S246_9PSEU|nr:hypothetical protein [Prauserella isguenensis]
MSAAPGLPAFAHGLCDDAAVFPPGLAPLPDAVSRHREHVSAPYRDLVGPLVLAAPAVGELAPLLRHDDDLALAVTAPEGPAQLAGAIGGAADLPVRVLAAEIAVPGEVAEFFAELDALELPGVTVHVEVPRDERRFAVLAGLAERGVRAKFRTGGVRADLHPDEAELATAVVAVARADIAFKATAGLHHAIRNTDPDTGFEQHGFLNLLLATDAALQGSDESVVAGLLARRDGAAIAAAVRELGAERATTVRRSFVSFGTCSIIEPLAELVELDLIPADSVAGKE